MSQTFYTTYLKRLYNEELSAQIAPRLENLVESYHGRIAEPPHSSLTEKDAILIIYGDQVQQTGISPLQTLTEFCETHLRNMVSSLHILPFFPWSSDDGFSIIDYRAVDPGLGTWQDIERFRQSYRLMFDGVINHVSVESEWFQAFLRNERPYRDYFITLEGNPDLSEVVRPRSLPLLTEFETATGKKKVWTTFSADQVDLNYNNPDVLLEMVDILLMYAARGAHFIRLDAIAYLWKELGTKCIHLPQTHAFVQLLRAMFDAVAPHVRLVTETNVPHQENLSYFGDGSNEAQLIYNFALPPMVLHSFLTGDSTKLSAWADGLTLPSKQTTFFNFLASHDGVGLTPVRGILSDEEVTALVNQTLKNGGLISYKQNSDGTQSPYELNISYFDALSDPNSDETLELQVSRFMAAHAIMLSLQGVPGIYFHSLFGSRNWTEGVWQSKKNRTINRQKLTRTELEQQLSDSSSLRSRVFNRFSLLLRQRASSPAFHPQSTQKILDWGQGVFSILRTSLDGRHRMLCLHNLTNQNQSVAGHLLTPYQVRWVSV